MHNICSVRPTPRLAPRRCSSSPTSLLVSSLVTALTDLFIANFSACSPADNYLGNYVTVAVPSPSALCSPQVAAQACRARLRARARARACARLRARVISVLRVHAIPAPRLSRPLKWRRLANARRTRARARASSHSCPSHRRARAPRHTEARIRAGQSKAEGSISDFAVGSLRRLRHAQRHALARAPPSPFAWRAAAPANCRSRRRERVRVRLCVCARVCSTHARTHTHARTRTHPRTHARASARAHMYARTHARTRTHPCTHARASARARMYARTHARKYVRTRTHDASPGTGQGTGLRPCPQLVSSCVCVCACVFLRAYFSTERRDLPSRCTFRHTAYLLSFYLTCLPICHSIHRHTRARTHARTDTTQPNTTQHNTSSDTEQRSVPRLVLLRLPRLQRAAARADPAPAAHLQPRQVIALSFV